MGPMAWKKIHHQIQRIYLGSKWHNDASHNVFWWSFWVPPTYRPQGWWKNPPQRPGISNNANLYGTFRGFEWICPWKCNVWVGNTSWPLIQLGDWWYQPHAFSWTFFTMPLVGLLEWEEWYWQIHGELFFFDGCFSWHWENECKLLYLSLSWYIHTIWRLYDMTTHHLWNKKEPGLPGVPFTFSLSESPWTPERSWLYPVRWPQKCWFWKWFSLSATDSSPSWNLLEPGRGSKLGILIWSRNASKILSI